MHCAHVGSHIVVHSLTSWSLFCPHTVLFFYSWGLIPTTETAPIPGSPAAAIGRPNRETCNGCCHITCSGEREDPYPKLLQYVLQRARGIRPSLRSLHQGFCASAARIDGAFEPPRSGLPRNPEPAGAVPDPAGLRQRAAALLAHGVRG